MVDRKLLGNLSADFLIFIPSASERSVLPPPPTHTSHTSIDDLHLGHIYCTPFMADLTSCSPGAPQDSARLQSAIPWISTSLMSVSCSSFSVSCSSHICQLFLFHQSAVPLTVHTSVSCSSYISQLFLLYQSAVPLI